LITQEFYASVGNALKTPIQNKKKHQREENENRGTGRKEKNGV